MYLFLNPELQGTIPCYFQGYLQLCRKAETKVGASEIGRRMRMGIAGRQGARLDTTIENVVGDQLLCKKRVSREIQKTGSVYLLWTRAHANWFSANAYESRRPSKKLFH